MSMLPVVSALSTMAVLPRPWLCVALASPADCAVCVRISPRMYDSVNRLEPTLSAGAASAVATREKATRPATVFSRRIVRRPSIRRSVRSLWPWTSQLGVRRTQLPGTHIPDGRRHRPRDIAHFCLKGAVGIQFLVARRIGFVVADEAIEAPLAAGLDEAHPVEPVGKRPAHA